MYFLQSRIIARRFTNIIKRNYMTGKGSREQQNLAPMGLTMASIKTHYSLVPLYASLGFAMSVVVLYCIRLATKPTDLSWTKEHEPWEYYRHREFKFINPTKVDHSTACQAPDYKH